MDESQEEHVGTGIVKFRKWNRKDIPFIMSSWLRSFRDGAWVRGIPNTTYFHYHSKLITELLARAPVIVVCDKDDQDQILGWVCFEKSDDGALTIHYVYVKPPFRGMGFASKVVEELLKLEQPKCVFYSHKTFFVMDYRAKCEKAGKPFPMKDWVYNPYLCFANLSKDWA